MSTNIRMFNPPDEDEKIVFRPQLFHYKYRTCIEKPRSLERYDPDTLKSLSNLMQSTKSVTRLKLPEKKEEIKPKLIQSQSLICPQWLKYDKVCLRFKGYFDEHVNESAYENWRVRPCTLLYYLDDDTFHIIEEKFENSGIPQGNLIKRRRVDIWDKPIKSPVDWRDINIGQNLYIYGKKFRICDCDKFTLEYYTKKGYVLNPPEKIPQIDYGEKYKDVDYNKVKKDIAEIKEFNEVSLGGGHPNGGLKQFLENDRKVLSFDIIWYDALYDKEEKKYKLNYYLSDNQVEVCEIKENNSGKDPYPRLLRKSKLPKKPRMAFCPGLENENEEFYKPEDLKIGNYIYVYGRKCRIVGCDEFTRKWYKDTLSIDMPVTNLKASQRQIKILHPIPPYNGFGSEEDSLLNVFYLDPTGKTKEFINEKFKRDKHILRYLAKLISSNPADEERKFLVSFYLRDNSIQVYEMPQRNNGRESGKFIEKQRIKNPYTNLYYSEKDFVPGNVIYINKFIFKLLESDEYTRKYMRDNPEVFRDSNVTNIINKIKSKTQGENGDDFLINMLSVIDPRGTNFANSDNIQKGFAQLGVLLSDMEVMSLVGNLRRIGNTYSMEDLFNLVK